MKQSLNLAGQLVGKKMERRWLDYNWRDAALYALAVGAQKKDLLYTYEKNMKALPSFGTIPYWGAINVRPRIYMPMPAVVLADEVIKPRLMYLNMGHELIMHRAIDPIKGTFQYQDVITDVYDRGDGKGVVVVTEVAVYDEAGNAVCTNRSSTFFHDGGGFGGAPMPANPVVIPDRKPDCESADYISSVQNMLYRLTGDTNLIHVDPDYVKGQGLNDVIMQGLCSFGFSCRMAIDLLIPGEPERMTRMAVQMRNMVHPGTPVKLQVWKMGDKTAYFRFVDERGNIPVLDRGVFEWA